MLPESERLEALEIASAITKTLSGKPGSDLSESSRIDALEAVRKLQNTLEKPGDGMLKAAFAPMVWMCIRTCLQLNVFRMLERQDVVSAEQIAKENGADERLIRYVAEKGNGLYGSTKWSSHLSQRTSEGMVKHLFDFCTPAAVEAPSWFKRAGYQLPTDPAKGIIQATHGFEEPLFTWFTRPEAKETWDNANTFFEGDRGSSPSWVSWFPVKEKLLEGYNKDLPVLVDVGGGRGHDVVEFYKRFPDVEGELILQDQQLVLDSSVADLPATVKKYPVDFFKEAPVKGARIYYMKYVLHDWQDDACVQILKNVAAAMTKGYSYLVINDMILPEEGCHLFPAQWDILLFLVISSQERVASQWKDLLPAAGLAIEGLYQPPGEGLGIIVATLK
ncbi:S-adenosyl-L-methionine-dependent methyltransferase [Daldinia decipiens]|uniref:S-adenosyl-L-methionine-dependent methyltransferase n=1 Tax=Daldinia decipiens TaxID=326647 RepID=UPI0020C2E1CC|nr:S-adenosyl-L-methionine-dependent methyltransferase [Daldinia decipiens]KAI1654256.1 S-adenosyl-L-methionine-dependent methyltransferase [Daldinia decipiens]